MTSSVIHKNKSEFHELTVKDIQNEANSYTSDFSIGPHSIWLKSVNPCNMDDDTTIGISESTLTVIDTDGNSVDVSLNEIIAYALFTGTPSDGE